MNKFVVVRSDVRQDNTHSLGTIHGTIVVSLPNGLEGRVSGTDVSHDAVLTPHNPAAYDKGSRVSEGIRHPESDWSSDVQTWFDQASCGRMDRFTATSRLKYV